MKQILADVALPVPLYQTFTYLVPREFAPHVGAGSRVLVPFGSKTISGIVVGFPPTTTVAPLKPIHDLLDGSPALSPELLDLGRWIADYYAAPIGEVFKAFLPQGIAVENRRLVSLKRPLASEELARLEKAAPQQAKVAGALAAGTPLSIAQLQKRTKIKGIYSAVSGLSEAGIIEIIDEIPEPRAKAKIEKFVLKKNIPEGFLPHGTLQQKLLSRIGRLTSEPFPLRSLLKETGASLSSVKGLVKKNIVDIVPREVERFVEYLPDETISPVRTEQLTPYQSRALHEIGASMKEGTAKTFLLHGITGSGKTQVYIEAIREAMARGKTAIVLVPEISLTPQMVRRFRLHFGNSVAVMHSRMSDGERYDAWRFCKSGKYSIVIGPRSAIFAPLANLGLIVVDEEHEASYKQFDSTPRYNARDVAVIRGSQIGAAVVLGSATPSVESFYNAQTKKYTLLELPERIDDAVLPSITLVNMAEDRKLRYAEMKNEAKHLGKKAFEKGFHSISSLLEEKIRDRLRKGEGMILLQNRRGFAPFMECLDCGHVERCDRCDVTLTYHLAKKHLRCHYCGSVRPMPADCPECRGTQLKLQGFGTQRVEQDLAALFPQAKVLRMDLDTTTRRGAHDKILQEFGRGEADILLGTQMVAKGLDFPRVTLVGVISADTQMMLPDFRSAERTFQLLTQVAGRAGRSSLKGEVVIQSYQTGHYGLKYVLDHNYDGFYREELHYRQSAVYPPFARLILIECKGTDERNVQRAAETFSRRLSQRSRNGIILGPAAAVISKIKNNYRWQILAKAVKANDPGGASIRNAVTRVVQEISSSAEIRRTVQFTVDVDPQGIM
ncbi:MAG TPA: primosomal protein N' [Bacteroidota bacterium]|nr:primosomal protein N' [Bacteroidota bacterium]